MDTVVLASKLAAVGYHLTIRTALGGGAGRSCFHNLHYEFLLVSGDPEFGTLQDREFIVDPHFRYCTCPGNTALRLRSAELLRNSVHDNSSPANEWCSHCIMLKFSAG